MELLDQIKKYKIILGSQSPRRQYLLKEMGVEFRVAITYDLDEIYPPELQREEIPVYLSLLKSNHLQSYLEDHSILITADTIVWLDGQVLGKPKDADDAFAILKKLSGHKHEVYSGVCIKSMKNELTFSAKTDVYFRSLTNYEINYYISNYQPYDKAGAYGAQEWIGFIGIEKIEGSYFNVMGLPVQMLYVELGKFLENEERHS